MPDDPYDIDELMSEDPLNLSTDPNTEGGRKLDAIIAYQRKQRGLREKGIKTKKPTSGLDIDIKDLLGDLVPKGPTIKRR